MLYVYIINILIYSGTHSILGLILVQFGYFGYRNIGTVRIFEGFGPVPIQGISVRFRFFSSKPTSVLSFLFIIFSFRITLFSSLVKALNTNY